MNSVSRVTLWDSTLKLRVIFRAQFQIFLLNCTTFMSWSYKYWVKNLRQNVTAYYHKIQNKKHSSFSKNAWQPVRTWSSFLLCKICGVLCNEEFRKFHSNYSLLVCEISCKKTHILVRAKFLREHMVVWLYIVIIYIKNGKKLLRRICGIWYMQLFLRDMGFLQIKLEYMQLHPCCLLNV